MEFYKVNFEVIEESFLQAESKEQIQAIFQAIATSALDSEIHCLKTDNLPLSLRSLPKTLGVSNDKAITVSCIAIDADICLVNNISSQSDEGIHWDIDDG